MKCIRCNIDNNYKERTANNGRCKNCQHPFAFEPKKIGVPKITDPFFVKAIASLSCNNNLSFTSKQFHYFLDRHFKKKVSASIVALGGCYLFGIAWLIMSFGTISYAFLGIYGMVSVAVFANVLSIWLLLGTIKNSKYRAEVRESSALFLPILGFLQLVGGVFLGIGANSWPVYLIFTAIGLTAIWLGILQKRKLSDTHDAFSLPLPKFQAWLTKWQEANGAIPQLLTPPDNAFPTSSQPASADIANYSFDRAVICDSAEIAQMLIANNFHIENNCAILSITGYPPDSFTAIKTMLQRNPNLQVYALHDLSPQGLNLTQQLRQSANWFANTSIPIIDVGLTPAQILNASRRFSFHRSPESAEAARRLAPRLRSVLSPKQYAWLECGNYIELEAFSPRKLIRILQRSLQRGQQLEGVENTLLLVEESEESSLYTAESFG